MENRAWTCGDPYHGTCPPPDKVWIFALCSRGDLSSLLLRGTFFLYQPNPLFFLLKHKTVNNKSASCHFMPDLTQFYLQEPAWVRANRVKNATQAHDMCSKQLLRTISGGERTFGEVKKFESQDQKQNRLIILARIICCNYCLYKSFDSPWPVVLVNKNFVILIILFIEIL